MPPWMPPGQPVTETRSTRFGRSELADGAGSATRAETPARRVADALAAGVLLVVLSPLLVAIAAAVWLASPGPVLFRQRRLGLHGREFRMLKFRTMVPGADEQPHREFVTMLLLGAAVPAASSRVVKLDHDPRVTRLGALLRRTSLDELPQLVNVLVGEMALVGPRPALRYEVELYRPRHYRRFDVKPGITGLWQVSGRSHVGLLEALELDVDYVERRSLRLDLWILLRTFGAVVKGGAR